MTNIKIAFFDVDGTLWPLGSRKLSPNIVYTLKRLQENNIKIVMATGRSVLEMPPITEVEFDAHLMFNGSYCFDKDGVIFKQPMDKNDVLQILENTKRMNKPMSISNEHFILSNGTDADLEEYYGFSNSRVQIADNFEELCREDIYQIMMSCQRHEYDDILRGTHHTKMAAWWERAADIIPAEVGKGTAVDHILTHYGLTASDAVAFGDGHNDIEMLQHVGLGVAMSNAAPEVKAAANEICKDAAEDGVYEFCKEMGWLD